MTANEEKVLKIVKKFKGKAHSSQIAKELEISSGYADLILKALQRRGKIEYSGGWALLLPVLTAVEKKEKKKAIKKEVLLKKTTTHPPSFHRVKCEGPLVKKPKKSKKPEPPLMELQEMTKELEESLQKAGYKDIRVLAEASVARLMEDTGLKLKMAANLINEARKILKIIPNTTFEQEKKKPKEKEKKEKPKKTTTHPSTEEPERKLGRTKGGSESRKRAHKQEKTTKRKEEKRITWPTKLLHRLFR